MKLRLLAFLAAVLAVLLAAGPAWAEKRIALVVGNGDYPNIGVLANPPNDARLMANTLRQVGFDVIERIDVDQKAMKRAISKFGKKLSDAGKDAVGLFYYAGHGVQVNGTNYLIPVNVDIGTEADVDIEAVAADGVQAQMAYAGNRLNIIVMDACRNNPFKRGFRSAGRGLARMSATRGTLIAYATAPGDVAADGAGVNSPYTEALAKAILTPGLTVERMFKQVRNDVVAATNEKQTPWESSSLTGADFYFRGGAAAVAAPVQPPPQPQSTMTPDMMAWLSIQDSTNPEEIEAFILAFRSSPFAGMARAKLKALKKKQQVVTVVPNKPTPSKTKAQPDGDVLPAQTAMVSTGPDEWLGADGIPTRLGRRMLPLIGVKPTKSGGARGYLGAEVEATGDWYLNLVRVVTGSPAERAGLRAGDSINLVNDRQIWHPVDFVRLVQRTGAGGEIKLVIGRSGYSGGAITVTLAAAEGDPWDNIDRYDIFATLLRETGMAQGARVVDAVARFKRITDPKYQQMAIEELVGATNQHSNRDALTARYNRGEISVDKWRELVSRGMIEGMENAFDLPSGVLTSTFDSAMARGVGSGGAFEATFAKIDPYLSKIGINALRTIFNRHDEVITPASK